MSRLLRTTLNTALMLLGLAWAAGTILAGERLGLKEAFDAGKLKLTFSFKSAGSADLSIENLSQESLVVVIQKGNTSFGSLVVVAGAEGEHEVQTGASRTASVTVEQKGTIRVQSGTMVLQPRADKKP